MRGWIFFFVFMGLAIALGLWLDANPGEVTIYWPAIGYIVTTPVWAVLAVMTALVVVTALLYHWYRGLVHISSTIARSLRHKREVRGYRALTQGLVAVAAGDAEMATRMARDAERLLDNPPLTQLLSAQTAQLAGDDKAAEAYFKMLMKHRETAFLGARGLLMNAIKRRDFPQALMLARLAHQYERRSKWVLRSLIELEARAANWTDVETHVRTAISLNALPGADAKALLAGAMVEHARHSSAHGRNEDAIALLKQARGVRPDFAPAATELAHVLAGTNRLRQATKALEAALRSEPHLTMGETWMAIAPDGDAKPRFEWAKTLLQIAPDHPATLLPYAEAALRAEAYAEARSALDRLKQLYPTKRVMTLAAELEQATDADTATLRAAFQAAADAQPDPTWTCRESGLDQSNWTLFAVHSGRFNTVVWSGEPTRVGAVIDADVDGADGPTIEGTATKLDKTAA